MKSIFILPFLCLITLLAFGQREQDTLSIPVNTTLVQQLFLQEINQHRASKSLGSLSEDPILDKAAQDQAKYCSSIFQVTHFQTQNKDKYSPKDRVRSYGGNHAIVGENCLMTFILQPFRDTKTNQNKTIYTYKQLARQLFEQWKNSPPHYKNILTESYTRSGFAFQMNGNNKMVYAVQVFGSDIYVPYKNGLAYSDTTFGILEHEPNKCKEWRAEDFLTSYLSNYLEVEDDSIFLYYQDEKVIRKFFENAKDGLAIDIVYKKQFKCYTPPHLHPSTVFDGYLLPPVYRDNLLKNDIYRDGEFKSCVGVIPKNAPLQGLQLNTVLVQNGMACGYSFPIMVEANILPDLSISPYWIKTEGHLKSGTVSLELEYDIPFGKNEKESSSYYFDKLSRQLSVFGDAISKIEIIAYSSIEGNETQNIALQNARATFIQQFIEKQLVQDIPFYKQSKENWNLFYEQFQQHQLRKYFSDTTKTTIRNQINTFTYDSLIQELLNQQRIAKIRIYIDKHYSDSSSAKYMPIILYDALQKHDTAQANIAYSRIIEAYEKGEIGKYYLSAIRIPLEKQYAPLINNYLASIILESDIFIYAHFNKDYFHYIDSAKMLFSNSLPFQFNLAIFKTHLYFRELVNDEKEFNSLESVILNFKSDISCNQQLLQHLLYNYYLTGSLFYRYKRNYNQMFYCFDKVKTYLALNELKPTEVYDIGCYFNYFYRFSETIELLEKYLKKYPNDDKIVYLYVSTGAIFSTDFRFNENYYFQQVQQLSKLNKPLLCQWFNENYQLLRYEKFEKEICPYCALKNDTN